MAAFLPIGAGTGLARFKMTRLCFTISWWRCFVPLIKLADGYSLRFRRPFAFIFFTLLLAFIFFTLQAFIFFML
jgi:hypothetical protein